MAPAAVPMGQPDREMIRSGPALPMGPLSDAMFLEDLGKALVGDPIPRTYLGVPTVTHRLPEMIPGLTVNEVWLADPEQSLHYSV